MHICLRSRELGVACLISGFLFSTLSFAQTHIPQGTIIPVQLSTSLNSRKNKPGHKIKAIVEQDVPLSSGGMIKQGSRLIGDIISVTPANGTTAAQMTFQFDRIRTGTKEIHLRTDLRALASMMDVFEAQVPLTGSDRGSPEDTWVTEQVGGEANYHGGWPIMRGGEMIGHSLLNGGLLAKPLALAGTPCRSEIDGNDRLQAFWVFASSACGVYGFGDLTISHAGRTEPLGEMTLTSKHADINVARGSGLLVRVIQPGPDLEGQR